MADKAKTLHVVCGPTAVGKTAYSIKLAQKLGTEVISADSRQLYREIPIGTAQPSEEELASVKHHFIASRSVTEDYNAGAFGKDALELLENLFEQYDDVVMCGGTGLYIKAVVDGFDDLPKADSETRLQIEKGFEEGGIEYLQAELKRLDPTHYETTDLSNKQRLMRALEVCVVSGKTYSEQRTGNTEERDFNVKMIGLSMSRELLNERINLRVDQMMEDGLLDEVRAVHHLKETNALQTLGYRELFDFLEEKWTLQEALEKMKTNTRRFAKRQMTWFRRDQRVDWIEV
ncbi:MAG: tRNA dimethylallyltransferase [Bacteroidia bacterium]|jgi:tRNA dimethylallyltransferase